MVSVGADEPWLAWRRPPQSILRRGEQAECGELPLQHALRRPRAAQAMGRRRRGRSRLRQPSLTPALRRLRYAPSDTTQQESHPGEPLLE